MRIVRSSNGAFIHSCVVPMPTRNFNARSRFIYSNSRARLWLRARLRPRLAPWRSANWPRRPDQRAVPRHLPCEVDSGLRPGPALRPPYAVGLARLHHCRCTHSRLGHRRQDRHLQRRGCGPFAVASLSRSQSARPGVRCSAESAGRAIGHFLQGLKFRIGGQGVVHINEAREASGSA